jgi:hypothetical protein
MKRLPGEALRRAVLIPGQRSERLLVITGIKKDTKLIGRAPGVVAII